MSSKDLREWLRDRRRLKSLELLVSHGDKVFQVVDELLNIARASMKAQTSEIDTIFKRQDQMERDADFLRRKMMDEIAKSELPSDMKKYFMELSREVDMIADYAHGGGRILTFLPLNDLDHEIKEKIEQMCIKTRECVLNLRDALTAMFSIEYNRAISLSDKVEEGEKEVDKLYTEARKLLLSDKCSNLDPRMVMFLSEFLEEIEDTSDRCEDSIDHFRILLIEITKPI
ncbi:MAG: DUF47 domain-containing protein [Thermoproteota archaeon]